MSESSHRAGCPYCFFSRPLILWGVIFAATVLGFLFFQQSRPKQEMPESLEEFLEEVELPSPDLSNRLLESVRNRFVAEFESQYGIELEKEEIAYLVTQLQNVHSSHEIKAALLQCLRDYCKANRVAEDVLAKHLASTLFSSSVEAERKRDEWMISAQTALLQSRNYIEGLAPGYDSFFSWWEQRHPEYNNLLAAKRSPQEHDEILLLLSVLMRRELVVQTANRIAKSFQDDLRARGKILSEKKNRQAYALFIRMGKEKFTEELIRQMADAVVKETEMTDEEVLDVLIFQIKPQTESQMAVIQDIQVRYLTPLSMEQLPKTMGAYFKEELQKITGIQ